MALFDLLGYDFSDPNGDIQTLTPAVKRQMNNTPQLLNSWQIADLENGENSGYFQNPCATVIPELGTVANTILASTSTLSGTSPYWSTVTAECSTLGGSTPLFLRHTNRLSGVEPLIPSEPGNGDLPHYDTAISTGKSVMYYTYQADGMDDNSALLGSFTSIMIANTLNEYLTTLNAMSIEIQGSITTVETELGITYTSNLSDSRVQTIASTVNTVSTLISTRRQHDENFFLSSRQLVTEAKQLRQFSNPGMSESHLLENYIGTDKLKSRLAQN